MALAPKLNPVILTLMISDSIVLTGFGLVEPVFALFVTEIKGGSVLSVGIATAIFMTVKSLLQLPFSRFVDKHDHSAKTPHHHLSTQFLWCGMALILSAPILYYFSSNIWHVYAIQALYGVGSALAYPTWLKLWEMHIDKDQESYEWTLYSTITSLTVALSAVVGGLLVQEIGFRDTFLAAAVVVAAGCSALIYLRNDARGITVPVKGGTIHP
jgi:DHA1 family quinolone resistance protein-like MFS transporter